MPSDAILKVIVDVQNSESIKDLTKNLEMQEGVIKRLNTALQQGSITQQQFAERAAPVAQRIINTNTALAQLQTASGNAGRGLSQLSYAVDDIQYGFNAIVNNIPQIVMGLGGSAGIAGAVGIAAVAINQLIKHWDDLTAAFRSEWSGTTVETIKRLKEVSEEAAAAFDKLAKASTKAQGKEVEGIEEIITEGPTAEFEFKLRKAIEQSPTAKAEREKARQPARFGAPGVIPEPTKPERVLEEEQRAKNDATAKRLMGESVLPGAKGDAARLAMRKLLPDMADQIEQFSPEGQKALAQKRLELEGGRNARKMGEKLEEQALQNQDKEMRAQLALQDHLNKKEREHAEEAHRKRIQGLEDQQEEAAEERRQIAEDFKGGRTSQVLGGGAKAAIDLYQSSVGNKDAERNALMKASDQKLKEIRDELKKERRVVLAK